MNLAIHYMYRDASNYQNHGEVVLTGVPKSIPSFEKALRATLDDGEYFIASQVAVPEVFLWDADAKYDSNDPPANLHAGDYQLNDDDHCYHELCEVEATEGEPTDERNPAQFLAAFKAAAKKGWQEFNPDSRRTTGRETDAHHSD